MNTPTSFPSSYPTSSPTSSPSHTNTLAYKPSDHAVHFFFGMIYVTLGIMAFLLLFVILLKGIGGRYGEYSRNVKRFCMGGGFQDRTSLLRRSRNIVDDQGRGLGSPREDEDDDDRRVENEELETDGFSLNLQNNLTIDASRWTRRSEVSLPK